MSEPPAMPRRPGMVGAMLSLGAAVLTMIGMFQALFTSHNTGDGQGFEETTFIITSWNARVETAGQSDIPPEGVPLNGIPLTVAIGILLAAAVLGMLRAAGRRYGRAAGLTAVVAAAFLAAVVATIGMQVFWWLSIFVPIGPGGQTGVEVTVTVGPGYWTLVVGVALSIAAAVVAWRHRPEPDPVREEPETPRIGIPVVVHRLPDEEPPPAQ